MRGKKTVDIRHVNEVSVLGKVKGGEEDEAKESYLTKPHIQEGSPVFACFEMVRTKRVIDSYVERDCFILCNFFEPFGKESSCQPRVPVPLFSPLSTFTYASLVCIE